MRAVLLDTDIGSDIDDAVALAYLLAHPECELVGITTVTGNTAQRAACARAICLAAEQEVPIAAGLSEPLVFGAGQPEVPQFATLRTGDASTTRGDAIAFMRETIRERPGEIDLLTIGPLTNVAALFAADPEIPSLLRTFTSMAGCYFSENRSFGEWNVVVDPVAAAIAFRRAPELHRCFGLDVTLQVQLERSEVERRFLASPTLKVVLEMASVWFERADRITFHDPLAAAGLFVPDLCAYERGGVRVSLESDGENLGRTVFEQDPGGRHEVARTVDVEGFFREYFSRTTNDDG